MSETYSNTGRTGNLRVAGTAVGPVVISRTVRRPRNLRVARRPVAEMIVDTGDRWTQTFNTEGRRVPRHYR